MPKESTEEDILYAIALGNGLYSDGPKQRAVPRKKAKLWKSLGHVKNHLFSASGRYDDSARIVELRVSYVEKNIGSAVECLDNMTQKRDLRRKEEQRKYAHREMEFAKKRLKEAKAKVKRLGR